MLRNALTTILLSYFISFTAAAQTSKAKINGVIATTLDGKLEGRTLKSGVHVFKGVPYAKPPVGDLRWKAPQVQEKWTGVKKAINFGPRPVQKSGILYEFRSEEMNEDCLYLNIWTAANSSAEGRPVYIFIHGGSFIHGDGSQPAYDGESMAKQGIVYVSINYRLGIFGFMAHPELCKESEHGASGNYGLLDQVAAFKWVKNNIAAFGGDPNKITIGGESVGAQSISAHMTSPLSKGLFNAAIAQSSSLLDSRGLIKSKQSAEKLGTEFTTLTKASSVNEMRKISAKKLLKIASKDDPRRFKPTVDGYFLTEFPLKTFEDGRQANVPLLVGWNADEVPSLAFYRLKRATPENFKRRVKRIYGENADQILAYYPVSTKAEAKIAGAKLGSDWLINYGSWRLADLHANNKTAPVYRYLFAQPHPGLTSREINEGSFLEKILKRLINKAITGSAFHAAEIEYALGNLEVQDNYDWKPEDHLVSNQMQGYFVNFIKNSNPNGVLQSGTTLANWPIVQSGNTARFMKIGVNSKAETEQDTTRARFLLLQKIGVAD
ncbi:carboxylesterase/lipase family protein [Pedobacter aquatilis]|uniref:carboxylesterase/lipase family protein n=1 Tax=Pedobacter aquatilis TaxID=351343 RepID=UPI00292D93F0|nr:carboxylesterase family protein [Pedobacter aquatilis]